MINAIYLWQQYLVSWVTMKNHFGFEDPEWILFLIFTFTAWCLQISAVQAVSKTLWLTLPGLSAGMSLLVTLGGSYKISAQSGSHWSAGVQPRSVAHPHQPWQHVTSVTGGTLTHLNFYIFMRQLLRFENARKGIGISTRFITRLRNFSEQNCWHSGKHLLEIFVHIVA